jgi:hypothetical protein
MKLRNHEHLTVAETEYGGVLLDAKIGQYWQLNPTATVVARTLLDGGSDADAVDNLTEAFDVDRDRATADVAALVEGLRSAGLVAP